MGKPVNKWVLLRELAKARVAFGVSERELTVLQGLLSFFPDDTLDGNTTMVVFPSNKAICERLHGMPCSTMRRHLARLVSAGLLDRRDSPNGKRYARKEGQDRIAFGFDLSLLYQRASEISRAAEAVRESEDQIRRVREVVSLMRRDLAALADFGEELEPGYGLWNLLRDKAMLAAKALRRKLPLDTLLQLRAELEHFLEQARDKIDGSETEELVTRDAQNEQHHHSSNTNSIVLEPDLENAQATTAAPEGNPDSNQERQDNLQTKVLPKIPLHLVTTSCPTLATFYDGPIRHWHQLYDAACHIRPAMGITPSAWEEAQRCMGPEQASVVVVAMLERFAEIRSPGGYLRALASKAASGKFSCGPMIMALMGRRRAA